MTDQGSVYASFIDDQLKAELARRASLDERGAKLQQAASLTVGLLAAALGFVLKDDERLAGTPLWWFVAAIALLVISLLFGVLGTLPFKYEVATASTLRAMLDADHWADSPALSRNNTAWLNATTLDRLRPGNNFKAFALTTGITLQGVGVVAGAVTFGMVAAGLLAPAPVP